MNQRRGLRRRWESQAVLETFRSSGPDTEQRLAMLTVSVQEYDTALHADARTAEESARSASTSSNATTSRGRPVKPS